MIRNIIIISIGILVSCSCNRPQQKNHLSNASSPYLQEHADNPVDWYEWGEEALQKAKKENKPLLISIGYASCHWCHVMEKESFMDTAVARLMNENFINIKVDREERPDIDNIYINACQLISGSAGWPLNAFALPDGKPFFAGTYYSKTGWMALLKDISKAYKEKNDLVVRQAEALTKGVTEEELSFAGTDSTATVINTAAYQNLFDSIYQDLDTRNGGLKGSPKFPMPALGEFLLQYHYLTGDQKALDAVTLTLKKMALGGIYDQVGGGFARYATDTAWHIPHFEKMLYDNGQLVSLYAHAYQVTKNDFFLRIIKETLAFVDRDLGSKERGFYSSLNADTDAGEGEFYSWSYDDFERSGNNLLAEYFNVLPQGNWEKGKNILHAAVIPAEFAISKKQDPAAFINKLDNSRQFFLTERNKRVKPSTDTKILASWNAIMQKGYIDAVTATGGAAYLARAEENAKFLEKNMMDKDGHLWRNFKDGKASIDAFLDDYAWLTRAWIRLYQVTFDKHWLTQARLLTEYAIAHFYDAGSGLFYYTLANSQNSRELAIRKMEIADNAIPSSNAIMAENLYQLGVYFENDDFTRKCSGMLAKIAGKMNSLASYYSQWCAVAGLISHGTYEVAIMGRDADKKNLELQRNYLPTSLYMGSTDEENLPLLENKLPAGKTLVYVCKNRTCRFPVEEVSKALEQMKK
jgi:uncharacterized protein YyaL (SSP411 family)